MAACGGRGRGTRAILAGVALGVLSGCLSRDALYDDVLAARDEPWNPFFRSR